MFEYNTIKQRSLRNERFKGAPKEFKMSSNFYQLGHNNKTNPNGVAFLKGKRCIDLFN